MSLLIKLLNGSKKITSKINLQYLVCKDICIPISIEKNLNHSLEKSSKDIKKSVLYNYLEKVPRQNTNYFSIKELKKISEKKISFKTKLLFIYPYQVYNRYYTNHQKWYPNRYYNWNLFIFSKFLKEET